MQLETIEQTLTKRLKAQLEPSEITKMANVIATLHENGIEIDDVFPFGVPTQPDAISVRGSLSAEQLTKLGELIPKIGGLKDYRVFPRGIVAPERYRVHLNLNR